MDGAKATTGDTIALPLVVEAARRESGKMDRRSGLRVVHDLPYLLRAPASDRDLGGPVQGVVAGGHLEDRETADDGLGLRVRAGADGPVARIDGAYLAWRGDADSAYADIHGYCKAAALAGERGYGHVLTQGRYVGADAQVGHGEPFANKLARLTATLEEQFAESAKLETAIRANLAALGAASSGTAGNRPS
jgi:hypothetical protein